MRRLPLILLVLLAACAATPPAEVPPVPLQPNASAADPGRQAVLSTAYVFADPRHVAGRPADAAWAVAQLEWMAVALPQDPFWIGALPTLFPALREATQEVRGALGVAPLATPAEAVQAFVAAAAAFGRGARQDAVAALAPVAAGGAAEIAARLDALPRLPRAAFATGFAQHEMQRLVRSDPE